VTRYSTMHDVPEHMRPLIARQLARELPRSSPQMSVAAPPPIRQPPHATKFGNVRVFLEGEWFDSKLEYDCWVWLRQRKTAGEIAYIKRQVTFVLEGGVKYRADFEVVLTPELAAKAGHCSEVWDAKGCDTRASINKRKQVAARYGIDVRLWTKANR
jgi:hypothetical protein